MEAKRASRHSMQARPEERAARIDLPKCTAVTARAGTPQSEPVQVLAQLTGALSAAGSLVLVTDYDGTLTPIVGHPAKARLGRGVRGVLRTLARSPRARVAVLSGRALDDLRARVGVAEVICGGCHGLEVEGPGVTFLHSDAGAHRDVLQAVAHDLRLRTAPIPHVRVEAKGLAVAVHYRAALPGTGERLRSEVERASKGRREVLEILQGKDVIEILPRVGWDKGACARWILDRLTPALNPPVSMLYMGDDQTDEKAFEVLAGLAITVKVGSDGDRSRADYRLRDTMDVQRLLLALAVAVEGGAGCRP